jgi:hypothetical protein
VRNPEDYKALLVAGRYPADDPGTQELAESMAAEAQRQVCEPEDPTECWSCKGTGCVTVWSRTYTPWPIGEIECRVCGGTGEVW